MEDRVEKRPGYHVEAPRAELVAGADAVIVTVAADGPPDDLPPEQAAAFVWRVGPGGEVPRGAHVCVAEGLQRAIVIAEDAADLWVVPRVCVRRASQQYRFDPSQDDGSGFKTYHLNPATFAAWEVREDGAVVPLAEWLERAAGLGFDEIWLHDETAELTGRGFGCDLIDRAHRILPEARFWISGGGRTAGHVRTIAAKPGVEAVVMNADLLRETLNGSPDAGPGDRAGPGAQLRA